jgi:hypothetical protein
LLCPFLLRYLGTANVTGLLGHDALDGELDKVELTKLLP